MLLAVGLALPACFERKSDTSPEERRDSNETTDSVATLDHDGDGHDALDLGGDDCDDDDASVHPDAEEVWYDGVDQDCSGGSDFDQDGDGQDTLDHGGVDCDDTDPDTRDGAEDLPGDGKDRNCDGCDGACTGADTLAEMSEGSLVISEIMADPAADPDSVHEWFEVYVAHGELLDLNGLVIESASGRSLVVGREFLVRPGQRVVFADAESPFANYPLGPYSLGNVTGTIRILAGATVVDEVSWGGAGQPRARRGQSLTLDEDWLDATANDDPAYWCYAVTSYQEDDLGTPGSVNDTCDIDGDGDLSLSGADCDDRDPTVFPGAPDETLDGVDQNCDGVDGPTDRDRDGYDTRQDCDDGNPAIHPGATEICYDGIDQDCDRVSDWDCDGDGAVSAAWGGDDCDDLDASTRPGAPDLDGDGVDRNCDGCDDVALLLGDLLPGDLVIDEIMVNPSSSEPVNEWFEVLVRAEGCLNLRGLVLRNSAGSESWTLSADFVARGGDLLVFGRSSLAFADLVYGSLSFSNFAADDLVLWSGLVVDRIAWNSSGDLQAPANVSLILDPTRLDAEANDDPANWCTSTLSEAGLDPSSPGAPNESCFGEPADDDGDGSWTPEDCDDADVSVFPGAMEIWYDGVDQDCSKGSDYDADGDGHESDAHGGDDCDDTNPLIHPDASDEPGDGWDLDCDGCDGVCPAVDGIETLLPGELIINEIMQNPSGAEPENEWFELWVDRDTPVDLQGLLFRDLGTNTFTVMRHLVVWPGEYVVFGKAPSTFVDYAYAEAAFSLGNGADEIYVDSGFDVIDLVEWDGGLAWPDPRNASMILDPAFLVDSDNENGTHWCASTLPWTSARDAGSPGEANESCFGPGVDLDGDGSFTPHDCDDSAPSVHPGAVEIWYDGVDQDCSGGSDGDQDSDGFDATAVGGADCDDLDAAVHPRATDPAGDGVDADCDGCDGACLGSVDGVRDLVQGSLVINEVMQNPSGSEPGDEWFEVWVNHPNTVDLQGLVAYDEGSDRFVVTGSLVVEPYTYVVFGKSVTSIVDYAYTSSVFFLGNGSDQIYLSNGVLLVDRVRWDDGASFPDPANASMILDPDHRNATDNDAGSNWYTSTLTWSDGLDMGSPGTLNQYRP